MRQMSQSPLKARTDEQWREAFGGWQERSILIVDDEPGMRNFLQRALEPRCGHVEAIASVEEASALLDRRFFDLILLDNALPGKPGVEWLTDMRDLGLHNEVIMITAFADLDTAIRALRSGVVDFLVKPFRINQVLNAVGRCFDRVRLRRENFVLRRELDQRSDIGDDPEGLIGESPALVEVRAGIKRLADVPSTVLIDGESGTGKEVAARALHRFSSRSGNHFVPVNCGAVAPDIIESELFGHVKGAFSGAASSREGLFFYAQGGTLFLDEVGELPPPMQVKLLRVLEERHIRPVGAEREIPVDVRVVAATNRDLEKAVAQGTFREDLYYRLDVVRIRMPALRDRISDLPLLARAFMRQLSQRLGVSPLEVGHEALRIMSAYSWPGNVRELRNVIERWLLLGSFPHLHFGDKANVGPDESELTLAAIERQHILKVLASVNGNKTEASRRLGLSRKTLERKCAEWGI